MIGLLTLEEPRIKVYEQITEGCYVLCWSDQPAISRSSKPIALNIVSQCLTRPYSFLIYEQSCTNHFRSYLFLNLLNYLLNNSRGNSIVD